MSNAVRLTTPAFADEDVPLADAETNASVKVYCGIEEPGGA